MVCGVFNLEEDSMIEDWRTRANREIERLSRIAWQEANPHGTALPHIPYVLGPYVDGLIVALGRDDGLTAVRLMHRHQVCESAIVATDIPVRGSERTARIVIDRETA